MDLTLDDLISEFLSFEKPLPPPKTVNRFLHRRDVDKQLQDNKEVSNAKVLKDGERAETFLNSVYYKELVQPFIHNTIKSNWRLVQKYLEVHHLNHSKCKYSNEKIKITIETES